MKHQTWHDIHKIKELRSIIEQNLENYDEIILFWDLNETLLNPTIGLNLKVNNAELYVHKFLKNFEYDRQKQIKGLMKKNYYDSKLGNKLLII